MSGIDELRLESRRLEMRPYRPQDLDELHRMFGEAGFRRYLFDGEVMSRRWVEREIVATRESFQRQGWGQWALRLRARPEIIGCCGLREFHRPPVLELFYGIASGLRGRGLATEAARAVAADAFTRLGFERLQASVDEPNAASTRVLAKLGMQPDEERRAKAGTLCVALSRSRWRAGAGDG